MTLSSIVCIIYHDLNMKLITLIVTEIHRVMDHFNGIQQLWQLAHSSIANSVFIMEESDNYFNPLSHHFYLENIKEL